jgi:drug/metabolite transporter (DMT)-like permease
MLFYFGLVSSPIALALAVPHWTWPSPQGWAMLAAVGTVGALSQYWWILAFRAGEASAVAPFDYSRLLFSALFGFAFFAEVPDAWTLAGAALIVASTIYIARREAQLR